MTFPAQITDLHNENVNLYIMAILPYPYEHAYMHATHYHGNAW